MPPAAQQLGLRRSVRLAQAPRATDYIYDMNKIPEDAHLATHNKALNGYMSGQDWHATYQNALRIPHGKEWEAAAQRELQAHAERGT